MAKTQSTTTVQQIIVMPSHRLAPTAEGGWVRREDPRNQGQFGSIDYCFAVPTTVTHADKAKVLDGLKRRGLEFKSYEWQTATGVLDSQEIQRVKQDVQLELALQEADLAGDERKATDLASMAVRRRQMAEGWIDGNAD
jgi:hypothetical protein